ncbi:MAG TPA: hypothetical protein VJS91_00505 [Nitrososphaeraceae archaeon]|nr:hypothetical protein [Nitrososphaeraceae archaeon]
MVDHTITNVTKDVLPLCTALVGFAGGAVTAVFGRSIAAERLSEKPSTQPNPQPAAPSNTPS